MKMKPEHFKEIKAKIDALLATSELQEAYEHGRFPNSNKTKDLNKRFRWDLLSIAYGSRNIVQNLYPYLNDSHIDTALRAICPKIERKY